MARSRQVVLASLFLALFVAGLLSQPNQVPGHQIGMPAIARWLTGHSGFSFLILATATASWGVYPAIYPLQLQKEGISMKEKIGRIFVVSCYGLTLFFVLATIATFAGLHGPAVDLLQWIGNSSKAGIFRDVAARFLLLIFGVAILFVVEHLVCWRNKRKIFKRFLAGSSNDNDQRGKTSS